MKEGNNLMSLFDDDKLIGQELSEYTLEAISGGVNRGLERLTVKCPVNNCDFECSTLAQLNHHMHSAHPERC